MRIKFTADARIVPNDFNVFIFYICSSAGF